MPFRRMPLRTRRMPLRTLQFKSRQMLNLKQETRHRPLRTLLRRLLLYKRVQHRLEERILKLTLHLKQEMLLSHP